MADPKSMAAAILGPSPKEGAEESTETTADDESAEDSALGASADMLIEAVKSGDRTGVIDALRSVLTLARSGM